MLGPMDANAGQLLTLVVGGEELLAERAVASIIDAVRGSDAGTEVRRIDAREPSAAGLVDQACSPTLFGGASVVVVENLDAGEPSVADAVTRTVRAAPDGVWIVALHRGGGRGKKTLDLLSRVPHELVECAEVKRGRQMTEFASAEFRRHKKAATSEALALLVGLCGGEIRELAATCAQLASDVTDRSITASQVRTYCGNAVDVTAYDICDAVLARDAATALRLIRTAELGDRGSLGPLVVATLARGLRQIARYKESPPGMSERDVSVAIGIPPWRMKALARQARLWRPEDVAAGIVALRDADAAMKGGMGHGQQLDPRQKLLALERVIMRLAVPARRNQA